MTEVFIPDNPPERSYTCPGCNKGVKCFRIGDSSSYWVMDAADEKQEHKCAAKPPKFPVPIKLLGYRPPKVEKKNETKPNADSGYPKQDSPRDLPAQEGGSGS